MSNQFKKRKLKFTQIANKCLNDTRLSLQAKGLMAIMLSNADDWEFRLTEIINRSTNGKDSTRAALHELENFGYLVRYRKRDKNGRLGDTVWYFDDEAELSDNPDGIDNLTKVGFSNLGKSNAGKPATNNTNNKNTKRNNTNTLSKSLSKRSSLKKRRDKKKNDFCNNPDYSPSPKKVNRDFLVWVAKLKERLRNTLDHSPTLSFNGIEYGLTADNLIYNKKTGKTLDSGAAMLLFENLYSFKKGLSDD